VFEPVAKILCPAFFIAVDWKLPRICLVVRGTSTWADSERPAARALGRFARGAAVWGGSGERRRAAGACAARLGVLAALLTGRAAAEGLLLPWAAPRARMSTRRPLARPQP
jgi:hypothetical protein